MSSVGGSKITVINAKYKGNTAGTQEEQDLLPLPEHLRESSFDGVRVDQSFVFYVVLFNIFICLLFFLTSMALSVHFLLMRLNGPLVSSSLF